MTSVKWCGCCVSADDDDAEALIDSDVEIAGYGAAEPPRQSASRRAWLKKKLMESTSSLGEMWNGFQSQSKLLKWNREYLCHGCLRRSVESQWFEPLMISVAVMNAAQIGVQIDHPELLGPRSAHYACLAFNVLYTFEIIGKLWVYGYKGFFKVPYNIFATIVTCAAWVEISANSYFRSDFEYLKVAQAEEFREALTKQFRNYFTTDLVQIVQLGRIIRLGVVFPTFGKLQAAFIQSLAALVWVFVLALLFFFLCACMATVAIGQKLWDAPTDKGGVNALKEVAQHFDSIPHSMFTLFELMCIEGWPDYVRPFTEVRLGIVYVLFFIAFIFVANFFLLNLITGVVVETMMAHHLKEDETLARLEEERREKERTILSTALIQRLRDLNADEDRGDDLSLKDFARWCDADEDVAQILKETGWTLNYAQSLARIVDHEATGEVSITNFQILLEECMQPTLNSASFAKFESQMASRMEFLESLSQEIMRSLEFLGSSAAPHA